MVAHPAIWRCQSSVFRSRHRRYAVSQRGGVELNETRIAVRVVDSFPILSAISISHFMPDSLRIAVATALTCGSTAGKKTCRTRCDSDSISASRNKDGVVTESDVSVKSTQQGALHPLISADPKTLL